MAFALFAARWVIVYINFVMCAMCNKRDFSFNFQIAALHAVVECTTVRVWLQIRQKLLWRVCNMFNKYIIAAVAVALSWVALRCSKKKLNKRFAVSQYI